MTEVYNYDKCLGGVCTINDKNVYSLFGADLKELAPTAGKITVDFTEVLNKSNLSVNNYRIETGGIKMIFYVAGKRSEDCYINTSNLIAECRNCIIRTDRDRFEYIAVLLSFNVKETGVNFYNEVTLDFGVIKRFPLTVHTFHNGQGSFRNVGSLVSGAKLTIVSKYDHAVLTVNGITLYNVIADDVFVIDGLAGTVTRNGVNCFMQTNLIDFPKVQPGINNVDISDDDVTVSIAYYPTFVV